MNLLIVFTFSNKVSLYFMYERHTCHQFIGWRQPEHQSTHHCSKKEIHSL